MSQSSSSGSAAPRRNLISSAVGSPMARLNFLRMYDTMASSMRTPPTRTELATTMPFIETTAASVVPPPRSSTILPVGVLTGRPAPIAAAMGSGIKCTSRVAPPAATAASCTARLSTLVTPNGTLIITLGLSMRTAPAAFLMK